MCLTVKYCVKYIVLTSSFVYSIFFLDTSFLLFQTGGEMGAVSGLMVIVVWVDCPWVEPWEGGFHPVEFLFRFLVSLI